MDDRSEKKRKNSRYQVGMIFSDPDTELVYEILRISEDDVFLCSVLHCGEDLDSFFVDGTPVEWDEYECQFDIDVTKLYTSHVGKLIFM